MSCPVLKGDDTYCTWRRVFKPVFRSHLATDLHFAKCAFLRTTRALAKFAQSFQSFQDSHIHRIFVSLFFLKLTTSVYTNHALKKEKIKREPSDPSPWHSKVCLDSDFICFSTSAQKFNWNSGSWAAMRKSMPAKRQRCFRLFRRFAPMQRFCSLITIFHLFGNCKCEQPLCYDNIASGNFSDPSFYRANVIDMAEYIQVVAVHESTCTNNSAGIWRANSLGLLWTGREKQLLCIPAKLNTAWNIALWK